MNNTDMLMEQLHNIGLGHYESKLYIELLKAPTTHLKLAHATGINRTKVYRLIDELERQSLVTRQTDDRGTFLVAADPSTLEVAIVTEEERLKTQREALDKVLPVLHELQKGGGREFVVNTYEGVDGFKQMLWHELKAKGECLVFGSGAIEELVADHRWAEKHRAMTLEADYTLRELANPFGKRENFTEVDGFMNIYQKRQIPVEVLPLEQEIVIYNDTVSTYHWRKEQKVGFEVISPAYAATMRTMFEHFWKLAEILASD